MSSYTRVLVPCVGCDSSVGIAGDSLRTGRAGDRMPVVVRFSALVQTGRGAHTVSYAMSKAACRGVDHPPLCSADVKERVGAIPVHPLCLHGLLSCVYHLATTILTLHAVNVSSIINVAC
jgi:hypothetical protein